MIDQFPNIKELFLKMGYANGMINREQPLEDFLASCEEVIGADGVYHDDLVNFENWLATLSREDQETLADGDETEAEILAISCPLNHEGFKMIRLLDDLFENA